MVLPEGMVLPFADTQAGAYEGGFSLVATPFQDTAPGFGEATAGTDLLVGTAESWAEPDRW